MDAPELRHEIDAAGMRVCGLACPFMSLVSSGQTRPPRSTHHRRHRRPSPPFAARARTHTQVLRASLASLIVHTCAPAAVVAVSLSA